MSDNYVCFVKMLLTRTLFDAYYSRSEFQSGIILEISPSLRLLQIPGLSRQNR